MKDLKKLLMKKCKSWDNNLITYFLFFLLITSSVFSQKINIEMQDCVSENETQREVVERLIKNIKSEALRKAGIKEKITSFTQDVISEATSSQDKVDQYVTYFNSVELSNITGYIEDFQPAPPKWEYKEEWDKFCVSISASMKVRKYKTKEDPGFSAKVTLNNTLNKTTFYKAGEYLNYNITPTQDCWLTIFYLTFNECSLIYPLKNLNQEMVTSNMQSKIYKKNKSDNVISNYIMASKSSMEEVETGVILTVMTKTEIPFSQTETDSLGYETKVVSTETIMDWIFQIEKDQRYIDYKQISVY